MIKINGRELPVPASYDYQFTDIDKDSGRNDNGYMMRERLGSKIKITLSWSAGRDPEAHNNMMMFLKDLEPFVQLTYPDPDGSEKTITCYRGDIKGNMYKYDAQSGHIWKEFSCSFIER